MKKFYVLFAVILMSGVLFAQYNHLSNGSISIKETRTLGNSPFSAVGIGKIINNNFSTKTVVDSLHYDGAPSTGIGTNGAATFEVYAYFPAASLAAHHSAGNTITMVKVFIVGVTNVTSTTIKIYSDQGTTSVYSQVFTPVEGWNNVTLTTPVAIPATDLYIGYQCVCTGGYPLGCDAGPVNQNGNWIVFNSVWQHLTALSASLTYNWNIRAMVSGAQLTNDIKLTSTYGDFGGFSYCEEIPLTQATTYDLKGVVLNAGSAVQTNVTLHAEDATNGINGTASFASLASGTHDTLSYTATLNNTTPTVYGIKMYATQNETDQVPSNNIGDSIYFATDNSLYLRTSTVSTLLTSYSFGTGAPAITGMEYGANYVFMNNDQVDSIFVIIYGAHGTGSLIGKLYSVDNTGTRTVVAQTSSYTPTGTPEIKKLALTTPYQITTPSLLTATVQLNLNISANDTIYIGADGGYHGDAAVAGAAYLNVNSAWGWYSIIGTCPVVGIVNDFHTGVNSLNLTNNVMVYPNPVSNTLYVVNEKALNVQIFNLNGQCVAQYNNENVINVANLAQGTYLVKVVTNNNVTTQKINIVR